MYNICMINDVYLLIPVYNEELKLKKVINSLKPHFKNIVVVNDGSTDSTQDIIDNLEVINIKHLLNLGQGAAISTGINFIKDEAEAKALVTFDADGQHSVDDALNFANEIISCEEDVIFGSRFIKHKENIPAFKRFILKFVTIVTNRLTKMKLTDSHNGLKAFKSSCLEKIVIDIDGFAFESQIINLVSKSNLKYKEMPTNTIYTEYSMKKGQKLRNGLIILEDLFKSTKSK